MTMFQNWTTKDEIETSIRTFQSVRDEIENTFFFFEWRGDENGRENLYYIFNIFYIYLVYDLGTWIYICIIFSEKNK